MNLYHPSREEFVELAAAHGVVPVWREVLADLQTPLAVYDRVRGEGPTFLLESVEHGERWGRWSFVGLRPFLELTARDGTVVLDGDAPAEARGAAEQGDPLATLEVLLEALRTPELPGLPPLFSGAVGYLGYDVVRFIERLPGGGVDDLRMPDARLLFPGQLIVFDHLRQRLLVVSNVREGTAEAFDAAVAASETLVAKLSAPVRAPSLAPPSAANVEDAQANMPRHDYLDAVERSKEYIRAGAIFQVVPSQRFSLATDVDPFSVYRVLRVINPSPYMYLFDLGDMSVVGSSPEALVTVRGGQASIWPIAGSAPRAPSDVEDRLLENGLRADEKERAEHVMLVDLARNDLGRVCELGSVTVDDFMDVVRYSHVMHLRSTVTGTIRPGVTAVDVLRATFPAGTLSGAPKVRAMEIIDELEPTRRGLFGGGIGYVDAAGNIDLCIAIRTVVMRGGQAYVQAGAGVVADSVPEREFAETQNKAMALLAAVRAAESLGGASA
ncbi:MAG: anthranilate synthase component I [Nitriliruptorales bacterium]|nr:anthranilate synthase component I [Nitriliruptorales bacterium]